MEIMALWVVLIKEAFLSGIAISRMIPEVAAKIMPCF